MSDPTIPPNDPTPPPPHSTPYSTPSPTPPPGQPVDYATPATNASGGMFAAPLVPGPAVTDPNARTWGLIAHLSSLLGFVVPVAGNIVGPLIVWQIKKDEIPFASDQAKEALNFNITIAIMLLICIALMCLVIGFFIAPLVGLYALVFTIIAAIKANNGEYYRYPATIRFVK